MNGVAPDGGMLEHLQAEHHKLNRMLSAIQHRIHDPSSDSAKSEVSADFLTALQSLRAELLAHFAEEGIDGCLGEAAARCPSVVKKLKAIAAEHETILQAIDELIASIAGDAVSAEALSRRFLALSEQLQAHELAETRLLQYALGSDVADYDVEGNE
jgi:hypothetical protein